MFEDNAFLVGAVSLLCVVIGSVLFFGKGLFKPPTVLPLKDFEKFKDNKGEPMAN